MLTPPGGVTWADFICVTTSTFWASLGMLGLANEDSLIVLKRSNMLTPLSSLSILCMLFLSIFMIESNVLHWSVRSFDYVFSMMDWTSLNELILQCIFKPPTIILKIISLFLAEGYAIIQVLRLIQITIS